MALVIATKDVPFGREDVTTRWQTYFPDASVTRLAEANHCAQEENPEAIADAVKQIAGQIES